jgi:hypothetical protein
VWYSGKGRQELGRSLSKIFLKVNFKTVHKGMRLWKELRSGQASSTCSFNSALEITPKVKETMSMTRS